MLAEFGPWINVNKSAVSYEKSQKMDYDYELRIYNQTSSTHPVLSLKNTTSPFRIKYNVCSDQLLFSPSTHSPTSIS